LKIIIAGGIVFVYGVSVQNIIRAQGNTRLAMNAMLLGVGLNTLLAPIFIFGFGMGVQGAATATVLAQGAASIWLLLYCIKGKGAVKFRSETLKPDLEIIKEIGSVGTGSFVMESASSVMMIFVYNALAIYGGDASIAVFGTVMRINSFIFLPLLGIAFGLQPIVGFNYGAKKYGRIVEAVKIALSMTTTFGLFGLVIIYLFKEQLLGLFSTDPEYMAVGKDAIMIMILGTPLIGLNVITSILFQALGKARPAFLLSISRQLLFLIPAVILLPRLYRLDGVWAAFPVSDFLAFMLSGFLLLRVYKVFKEHKESSKMSAGSEITDKVSHI
jgi:putative MATE family efflux protein